MDTITTTTSSSPASAAASVDTPGSVHSVTEMAKGKATTLSTATSPIVPADAATTIDSESVDVTHADVLAATSPFENVFTPVRLNRADDRCVQVVRHMRRGHIWVVHLSVLSLYCDNACLRLEWVVRHDTTGVARLVTVPFKSVDGLQLGNGHIDR